MVRGGHLMSHGLVHPFSKALYVKTAEGNIRVTDGDKEGLFRVDGSWIEGELRECDPQLCGWVGGPVIENHRVGKVEN
jgi:hypothetical protein